MGLGDIFATGAGIAQANTGSEIMTFDGVTEGIDKDGIKTYMEELKLELLDSVKEKIDAKDAVEDKINAGWQGVARDNFLRQFATQRNRIKDDLEKEYLDLIARIHEIQNFYFKQDQAMVDMIDN